MSKQYDNTNSGAIWPARERKTDKHPTHTGTMNVDGVEYYVSAWRKSEDASPNAPALKFSIKRKDAVDQQGMAQAKAAADPDNHGGKTVDDFEDSSIPF